MGKRERESERDIEKRKKYDTQRERYAVRGEKRKGESFFVEITIFC